MKGKLNVDAFGAISELEAVLKEFRLRKIIYKLFFRGKGLEFDGYRDFAPDDDAERIDWKASSRAQKTLVKQFIEERDLKVMFVVDVGKNMVFGSSEKLKCEFVAETVAAFAKIITNNNDRIGFILYSDSIVQFIECKSGAKQFHLLIDTLSDGSIYGGTSNLDQLLDFCNDYLDESISAVVLVSDFLRVTEKTKKKMSLLGNRIETVALRVRDPLDISLPYVEGEIVLQNSEGNQQVIVNPNVARENYKGYALEQAKIVEQIFRKSSVDFADLVTNENFAIPLVTFLQSRLEGVSA